MLEEATEAVERFMLRNHQSFGQVPTEPELRAIRVLTLVCVKLYQDRTLTLSGAEQLLLLRG